MKYDNFLLTFLSESAELIIHSQNKIISLTQMKIFVSKNVSYATFIAVIPKTFSALGIHILES